MKSARANFALTVIDNFVYVYGGIQNRGTGNEVHKPITATIAEKYDPITNIWETLEIQGAISLAAFGWTTLDSNDKILILGGSDGDTL